MRLQQTRKIMDALRLLNRGVAKDSKRIEEWVDDYVNDRILNGEPVEILLQWCCGLGLEKRMQMQGGEFVSLPTEIDLVQKQIPRIINIFSEQSVVVSWVITFNRSYIERRKLPDKPFRSYVAMIKALSRGIKEIDENILFFDWEELTKEIKPNAEVLSSFDRFVSGRTMEYEVNAFLQMLKEYPDALDSEEDLKSEAQRRIAFECEEAFFLTGAKSPFADGRFILIPLERSERYVFFDLLAQGFTKRIASVVKLYPWRIK